MSQKKTGAVSGDGIGFWQSSTVLWRQGLSWKSVTSKVLVAMPTASITPSVQVAVSEPASVAPSTLVPLNLG